MESLLETNVTIPAKISSSDDDVFETGKFDTITKTVKTSDASKPPTELFIVSPVTNGTYPVLIFCHGFLLSSSWYSQLLKHIASHGYIVIAPKFYGFISFIWTPITKEIEITNKLITEYLPSDKGLINDLPEKVSPDLNNLAISGHSRGGKSSFALALDQDKIKPYKFKALIGIDPSAGGSISFRLAPKILTYVPRTFDMKTPVCVIGASLSCDWLGLIPPPAPYGCNHSEFFNESKPPVCYFLARDCGHCDMMDDGIVDVMGYICKSGNLDKKLVRKGFGGIVVAFLKAYLGDNCNESDLDVIVEEPSVAPLKLDPVIYVKG